MTASYIRPGVNWRTPVAWDANTAYKVNDGVTYNGSSYRCITAIAANGNASAPPNDSARWTYVALKGDTGPQGVIGATGDTGAQGDTGPQGPQGDVGPQGSQGPQGVQGAQGNAGQSFTWKGAWSGATAYVLDDAVRGSDGSTYIAKQANTNHDPTVDASGGEGTYWSLSTIHGATGAQGAQGPQGDAGPQGPTGATGSTGATGATGADGHTILNTVGAPSAGTGVNGDYALDVTTDATDPVLYGPKAGGVWPAGIHLKGPTGATGATGAAGSIGVPAAWDNSHAYAVGDLATRGNALFICKTAHTGHDPFTDCAIVLAGTYWTFFSLRGAVPQTYNAAAEQIDGAVSTAMRTAPTPDEATVFCPSGMLIWYMTAQYKLSGSSVAASTVQMQIDDATVPALQGSTMFAEATTALNAADLFWGHISLGAATASAGYISRNSATAADEPIPTLPFAGGANSVAPHGTQMIWVGVGVHKVGVKFAPGNATTIVNVRERRTSAVGL